MSHARTHVHAQRSVMRGASDSSRQTCPDFAHGTDRFSTATIADRGMIRTQRNDRVIFREAIRSGLAVDHRLRLLTVRRRRRNRRPPSHQRIDTVRARAERHDEEHPSHHRQMSEEGCGLDPGRRLGRGPIGVENEREGQGIEKNANATQRAYKPAINISPPPSSRATAPQTRISGYGSPWLPICAEVAAMAPSLLMPPRTNMAAMRKRPRAGIGDFAASISFSHVDKRPFSAGDATHL